MSAQSGVLIVVLLFVDFLIRKRVRATLRYWIWMLVFVKLILPPSLSLPTGLGYWRGEILPAASPVLEEKLTNIRNEFAEPPRFIDETPLLFEIPQNQSPQTTTELTDPATPVISHLNVLTWQAIVFVLWLAGVLVFSALLIQRLLFVGRLITQSGPAEDRFTQILDQCRQQVCFRRFIELRLSNDVFNPAVCGFLKPVILIPSALIEKLTPDRLNAVLIHELCHLKRGDLWINAVQTVLQIVYFYNPLVWLVNVVARRIREQAVDEMVLVTLGTGSKDYSNTLIDIAEMAFFKTSLSLRLIGVVESKKALEGRIKHMLNRPIPKHTKLGALSTIAIIVLAAAFLPMAKGERNKDICNPVSLDKNGKPIVTHTLYIQGQPEKPVYLLEGKTYNDVKLVVAHIGKLMKQKPFPMIRVYTTSQFQRQQEPIEQLSRLCKEIGFINMEFKYDLEQSSNRFKTRLPDGVVIELVGVCEHPSKGKQWWRPDGTPIETDDLPDYDYDDAVTVRENEYDRLLAFKLDDTIVQNAGITWSLEDARESRFAPDYTDKMRTKRRPVQVILAAFPETLERANLRLGIAAGPWEAAASGTHGTSGAHTLDSITQSDVIYHEAHEEKGTTFISATHLLGSSYDCRIYARGKNGETYEPRKYSNGGRKMRLCKSEFDIPLEKVKLFHLQARPFHWVTFENISLQRGSKTNVKIEIDGPDVLRVPSDKYPTIQSAVNAAKNGDKLVVHPSVFTNDVPKQKIPDKQIEKNTRTILLPDVDTKGLMLDLASGELLDIPKADTEEEIWSAIEKLGKGDVVYDASSLILVRGATTQNPTEAITGPFKACKIEQKLPVSLTITTKEGIDYAIKVQSADNKECRLEYYSLDHPKRNSEDLARQLAVLEHERDRLAERIKQYRQTIRELGDEFGDIDLKRRQQIMLDRVATLMETLTKTEAERIKLETEIQILERTKEQPMDQEKLFELRQAYINGDPAIKAYAEDIIQLEREVIIAKQTKTETHPEIQRKTNLLKMMKERLAKLKQQASITFDEISKKEAVLAGETLLATKQSELEQKKAFEQRLRETLTQQDTQTIELGRKQLAINDFATELKRARERYDLILNAIMEVKSKTPDATQLNTSHNK